MNETVATIISALLGGALGGSLTMHFWNWWQTKNATPPILPTIKTEAEVERVAQLLWSASEVQAKKLDRKWQRLYGHPMSSPLTWKEADEEWCKPFFYAMARAILGLTLALVMLLGCSGAQFDLNTEEGNDAQPIAETSDSGNDLRPDETGSRDPESGNGGDGPSPEPDGGLDTSPPPKSETSPADSALPGVDATDTAPDTSPPADTCPYDAADHHNGVDGPYAYCAPKGDAVTPSTYSLGMALAARASSSVPGSVDTSGTCPTGSFVRRASASKCVTWGYDGAAFGRVTYGAICGCPEATGPRWD